MENLLYRFDTILVALYFCVFLLYVRAFFSSHRPIGRVFLFTLPSVLILHLVKLILQGKCMGHCPILGLSETFSFTAFALGLIYFILERRQKYYATGVIFIGIVLLFQSVTIYSTSNETILAENLRHIPFAFHGPLALIGISAFGASALYGVLYLILFRLLKTKQLSANLGKMPPLEKIEAFQKYSSLIGFVFFSIAVISGFVLGIIYEQITRIDPKIIISLIVLAIFGYEVIGSRFCSFSGKKRSIIAIVGFTIAVVSMAVVRFSTYTFHRF